MGAIASGGITVLERDVVDQLGIPSAVVDRVARAEQRELERREVLYRGNRPYPELHGRTVIVVDDGLATGATMAAAVAALRELGPSKIIVAVPVGSTAACAALERLADECVCLAMPEPFYGVGMWYHDFAQTTDDEVRWLLAEAEEEKNDVGTPARAGAS
jgi:predicted phosphoribosyltransferase